MPTEALSVGVLVPGKSGGFVGTGAVTGTIYAVPSVLATTTICLQ